MSKRLTTALAVALALLISAPAYAQTATPTAAPGEPPVNATAAVKKIYTDYRDDGVIVICDHKRDDLQKALDTIEPQFDTDYPDFREALQAGIQKWDKGKCVDTTPTPTATATATASATATATSESGALPPPTDDGGNAGGPKSNPPAEDGTLPAPTDSATPAGAPAVPTATTPPVTAPVTPSPTATAVVTRTKSGSLLVPGIILGIVLVGAAALAFSAVMARRNPSWDHAWREASFRVRGTWADFSDWLKLGR